jgi:hypothetical protein
MLGVLPRISVTSGRSTADRAVTRRQLFVAKRAAKFAFRTRKQRVNSRRRAVQMARDVPRREPSQLPDANQALSVRELMERSPHQNPVIGHYGLPIGALCKAGSIIAAPGLLEDL